MPYLKIMTTGTALFFVGYTALGVAVAFTGLAVFAFGAIALVVSSFS